jgi:hypothetical protein
MFLVAMFIVYFDYILSIAGLSLCLCTSSYSVHPNVHRVSGRDHVSVVLICYLPVNTLYILGHVIDRGCDTTVESFVAHSPNIGHSWHFLMQSPSEEVLSPSPVMAPEMPDKHS